MNSLEREVIRFVRENDIKFIRLAFSDIFGKQKNIAIMSDELERAFENGILFDAFSIEGFKNSKSGDLLLFPDPATIAILPWRPSEGRVARFFCDIRYSDGTQFEADSRFLLKQTIKKAREMGFVLKVGAECEFYIVKKDDSGKPTLTPYDEGGYFDISPLDRGENIRREICLNMEEMGITPRSSHHERGPGQHRVKFRYADPLTAADDFITFKWIVKAIASRHGGFATFMPKPIEEFNGSALQLGLLLFKNGENLLSTNGKRTEEMDFFIAGILNRIGEITAILNPTENSYQRFGEFNAPKEITWSDINPKALIRLNDFMKEDSKIKIRSVDPTTNPYLAISLMISAGLEGIKNREKLSEDRRIKTLDEQAPAGELLPLTLDEAVKKLEESSFAKEMLGDTVLNNYASLKKTAEADSECLDITKFLSD